MNFKNIKSRIIIAVILISVIASVTAQSTTSRTQNIMLPPAWAFGVLWGGYTNQEKTVSRIDSIEKNDLPIDAYWIDSWYWDFSNWGKNGPKGYMNFKPDSMAFPAPEKLFGYMKANTIKSGVWIWDAIHKVGNEEIFEEFASKNGFQNVYNNTDTWHNNSPEIFQNKKQIKESPLGEIDFKNPTIVALFKEKMLPIFQSGVDFLKLDRTSNLSFCKAAFEASSELGNETKGRGFVMSHSMLYGHEETDSLKNSLEFANYPCKWTDDTKIVWSLKKDSTDFGWTVAGFKENVEQFTNPTNYYFKIPFLTCDAGGYKSKGQNQAKDEELYMRWNQFAMFTPIFESFSDSYNPTNNLPWRFSKNATDNFRFYAHLRLQLFPYIYTYAHLLRITNYNIIRVDSVNLHQYLFGNELLVAPVVEKGQTVKKIVLPAGKWIDYYDNSKVYSGNQTINYKVTPEILPILVRASAIIPLRNYQSAIEKGNNDTLTLDMYPSFDKSEFELIEDDGTSNDYLKGAIARTKIQSQLKSSKIEIFIFPVVGSFVGMKTERTYILKINQSGIVRKVKSDALSKGFEKKNLQTTLTNNSWFYDNQTNTTWVKVKSLKSTKLSLTVLL